jgi:hypothetical protein
MLFPEGVRRRPLGITVTPSLLIYVYIFAAGAEIVYSLLFRPEHDNRINAEKSRHITLPEKNLKLKFVIFII